MVACNIKHPDKLLLLHLPATWSIVLCLLPAWLDFDPPPTVAHFLFPLPFALCPFWYLSISVHLLAIASNVFISFIHISSMLPYALRADSSPPPPTQSTAGDLTMPDFMAYIGIMRRLLGNEFVCGADIVAIPKEDDRFWINEHIRDQRPGKCTVQKEVF